MLAKRLPHYFLGLSVFLIPFYIFRFDILGLPTNIFEISTAITLVAALWLYMRGKRGSLFAFSSAYKKLFWSLIAAFVAAALLGAWQSDFSREALGIVKSWVIAPMLLAFSFQLLAVRSKQDSDSGLNPLSPTFLGVYASTVTVSVWALLQRLSIINTLFYQQGDSSFSQYLGDHFRAFGPFESPNYLAMFIIPSMFLALGIKSKVESRKSKVWEWAFYLSFILPLLALNYSGSRAGVIALVGASLVSGSVFVYHELLSDNLKQRSRQLIVLLYLIFYLALAYTGYYLIKNYFINSTSDPIRFEIYRDAWQLVKNNWLTGIGSGRFQDAITTLPMTESFRQFGLPYALHPHNLYLALWLNFGLLGLISFLGITTWSYCRLFKYRSAFSLFLLAALLAISIHGIFDTTYFKNDLSAMYWLIITLSLIWL